MLDKTLPFYDVIMKMPGALVPNGGVPQLPEGYSLRLFQAGDEDNWARIESAVLEFDSEALAKEYYVRDFLPQRAELERRAVFAINPAGIAVATATAWFAHSAALGYQPSLHWVSADPAAQGKGLGKAVVQRALQLFAQLDPGADVILHTQTWSHKAIGLYHKLGFYIAKTDRIAISSNGPQGLHIEPNRYDEAMTVLKTVMPAAQFQDLCDTAR